MDQKMKGGRAGQGKGLRDRVEEVDYEECWKL